MDYYKFDITSESNYNMLLHYIQI